jgi:hypothetical protein
MEKRFAYAPKLQDVPKFFDVVKNDLWRGGGYEVVTSRTLLMSNASPPWNMNSTTIYFYYPRATSTKHYVTGKESFLA